MATRRIETPETPGRSVFSALFSLLSADRRTVTAIAVGLATAAATAFVISVIASTQLIAALHPQAPANVAQSGLATARLLAFLSFTAGVYSLLGAIGVMGWVRSRAAGVITTLVAGAGGVLITLALASG